MTPGRLLRPTIRMPACLTRRTRSWAPFLGTSILILIPCFWQSRIQAGDLSSHLYNAWLASLVREGRVEGLAIVPQFTNILFDLLLEALMQVFAAPIVERAAVSLAVLVFFWGAFALISAVNGGPRWWLTPCLAMLSYGWVFHMGFFNFYLSLGLCLWVLAAHWQSPRSRDRRHLLGHLALFGLAWTAHAIPVLWCFATLVYVQIARRARGWSPLVLLGSLAAVFAVRLYLSVRFTIYWSEFQVFNATGADQLWLYGLRYAVLGLVLLAIGVWLFVLRASHSGFKSVLGDIPFQLCLLNAAGIVVIPAGVVLPWVSPGLTYIADRMSLPLAVFACGFLASAAPARFLRVLLVIPAAVYFGWLQQDAARLNRVEDAVNTALRGVPPGQPVMNALCAPPSRINPFLHTVSRACIGRCFSYSNYEAPSGAFRLRSLRFQRIVLHSMQEVKAAENGRYAVLARDLPLYEVYSTSASSDVRLRQLSAGDLAGPECR